MSKFRKTSLQEAFQINDILKQVLHKEEDDTVSYTAGWDDERVARQVSDTLNARHAARVRMDMHGQLHKALKKSVNERLDEIERRLHVIEQYTATSEAVPFDWNKRGTTGGN